MTLRTGTSKSGQVHRYYACSTCARHGKTACKGRSIRMDKLDAIVTSQLADRLLEPQRLSSMLASLASGRAAKASAVDERIVLLEREAHEATERLRRLYKAVGRIQRSAISRSSINFARRSVSEKLSTAAMPPSQIAKAGEQFADQLLGGCVSEVAGLVELACRSGDHHLGLVHDGHVEEHEALA